MKGLKSIVNAAAKSADLFILDDIGPSWAGMVGAVNVQAELKAIGAVDELIVHLNSYGGSVFEGFAIYNLLKNFQANVTMIVEGVAASAASTIAMSGDKIIMASHAYMMIHNPSGGVWGEAGELRKHADLLDQLAGTIAQVYVDRSGKGTVDDYRKLMADETWFTSEQAVEQGLANEVDRFKTAATNSANPRSYEPRQMPDDLKLLLRTEEKEEAPPAPREAPLRNKWKAEFAAKFTSSN